MSGAHIAIHVAAQQQEKHERQEEEQMTNYTHADLQDGWEFKIVRSATGAFKRPDFMANVLDEEALSGWQLVEKFDDNRLRLKRAGGAGRKDDFLPGGVDPYRTHYGMSENRLAVLWVLASIAVIAGVIGLVIMAAA